MKITKSLLALSPLVIFLGLYIVISLIIGDFYKAPLTVALLVATLWALIIYTDVSFPERIEVYAKEAGNSNILYMVWIFILAGITPTAPWRDLFYPWILAGVVTISIIGCNYFYKTKQSKLS